MWIDEKDIELCISESESLESLNSAGFKYFKNPKNGTRRSTKSYYIRNKSGFAFSKGPYDFYKNETLENLCVTLNKMGYIFWSIFKTEISPYDYMRHLQRIGVLNEKFSYIEAGNKEIYVCENENA